MVSAEVSGMIINSKLSSVLDNMAPSLISSILAAWSLTSSGRQFALRQAAWLSMRCHMLSNTAGNMAAPMPSDIHELDAARAVL